MRTIKKVGAKRQHDKNNENQQVGEIKWPFVFYIFKHYLLPAYQNQTNAFQLMIQSIIQDAP